MENNHQVPSPRCSFSPETRIPEYQSKLSRFYKQLASRNPHTHCELFHDTVELITTLTSTTLLLIKHESACVNRPLHHKVQKFSSGTGSPGWSQKKGRKTVVVWCGGGGTVLQLAIHVLSDNFGRI